MMIVMKVVRDQGGGRTERECVCVRGEKEREAQVQGLACMGDAMVLASTHSSSVVSWRNVDLKSEARSRKSVRRGSRLLT
jgi:hypothetical protein